MLRRPTSSTRSYTLLPYTSRFRSGVMGGAASGCTEATTSAFLEVALFDPVRIAATGRRLGIESDARFRFERRSEAHTSELQSLMRISYAVFYLKTKQKIINTIIIIPT